MTHEEAIAKLADSPEAMLFLLQELVSEKKEKIFTAKGVSLEETAMSVVSTSGAASVVKTIEGLYTEALKMKEEAKLNG